MIPINTNATGTVGLVEMNNPKSHFMMEVNPVLLKQWADAVMENLGTEDVVYLSVHRHTDPMNTARILSASAEYGDEIQVVVCGTDCDDVVKRGEKE
jgi:uncharacterized membrane protein